jgi:hypothetical protein
MAEATPTTKPAIISIGKALLGVSFAALAAFGSASGPGLATALAVPGAVLSASDSLKPLLTQLKGKKEDVLEIPIPSWWSRRNDASWQNVCVSIESHLPAIINATVQRLEQEKSPIQPVILRIFISEIERQIPAWEVAINERGLVASYVAKPFLERVASLLKMKTDLIQLDAVIVKVDLLAAKVEEVAIGLATLAVQVPTPRVITPTTASNLASVIISPVDQLEQKLLNGAYDVYVCYHQKDTEAVGKIDEKLKAKGILPWFDILETDPGKSLQAQQSAQIIKIKSAAVFVGKYAVEGWQALQVEALLNEFVKRQIPVIPVLLQDAPQQPELSPFLGTLVWVDFHKNYPDPMARLVWGITGVRPTM